MAVTKIQRVKSVRHAVNYITSLDKTERNLIYSHECTPELAQEDFESVLNQYNHLKGAGRELNTRMIIQSYDPDENITPEQAHEYGKEFAKNYLKDDFQYILATHHDTDHIHNHIIFNDINYKTLEIFDSTRENTLNRMRNENDLVSEKYGLKVIEKTRGKHKYLTHKDYVARSKGVSFKGKMEKDLDVSISESHSYDDFLKSLEIKGYEIKQGKNLAIKSPSGKRFMRTKTLGFNYLENSIKHRIENKDYVPLHTKIVSREWIDKDQDKFKHNKGLRNWGSLQNINYLHEVNKVLSKEGISLEQFTKDNKVNENFEANLEKKLSKLDNLAFKLEGMSDCYQVYKDSYRLMVDFKKLDTIEAKDVYKEEHYAAFKKYDTSRKDMNLLKKGYQINNESQLKEKIALTNDERDLVYESVNLNKGLDLDKKRRILKEAKHKNNEMEL